MINLPPSTPKKKEGTKQLKKDTKHSWNLARYEHLLDRNKQTSHAKTAKVANKPKRTSKKSTLLEPS